MSSIKMRSPTVAAAAVLGILCGLSLYLRICLSYDYTFVGDWVWLRGADPYYYLRNIENMVRNFPHFNLFDPYLLYPGGGGLGRPLFAWLVAGAALIVGGGNPTPHTVAAVSAYMPPILGTLTLIPVYLIGKELFSRWAGLFAAALVAILPGEYLHRSLLGFTDHHVAEVLLGTTTVLFLIMAVKRSREITFRHILTRDGSVITRPLVYALLSGVFLGAYFLAWQGGLMFVFILFVYLVIQFIIDHLCRRSTDYLCILGVPLFLTALLISVAGLGGNIDALSLLALTAAVLLPVVLSTISRFTQNWKPVCYPITLLACAGLGFAVLRFVSPPLFQSLIGGFGFLFPGGAMRTVMEVQPLSMSIAWSNFTSSFLLSLAALAVLIYTTIRERRADRTLFLVWSLITLVSVLGQRRFGYYYAVNAALLTGYLSWKALELAGLYKLLPVRAEGFRKKEFRKQKHNKGRVKPGMFTRSRNMWARVAVAGAIVFLLVFLPNIKPANVLASNPSFAYSSLKQGWYESCLWLRDNTPEPFGDPDFYYQPYSARRDAFDYPDTMYGVLSWWDYGYFIAQIGHRVPNANPSQGGAVQAGLFFTSQNTTAAGELADQRRTRYIVIDHTMPTTKFYAMVEWAGGSVSDFFDIYYQQAQNGQLESVILYHPAYYRSTAVRLYNFDGQPVTPTESIVITYENRVSGDGVRYKQISGVWYFDTYEEAEAYITAQKTGNYQIVGADPLNSPVPLSEMVDYELVYVSLAEVSVVGRTMPGVKIFEYHGLPSPAI